MSDFGFVGAAYTAQSPTQDDQELLNWYCETDPTKNPGKRDEGQAGDRGVMALYPTPGTTTVAQPQQAPVRALRPLPGGNNMIAVIGDAVYYLDTTMTGPVVGTVNTDSGPVIVTDNGTSAYLTDGSNRYYYTWGSDTFATVTDGAFDGGTFCDFIDNFIIYNQPNTRNWGCTDVSSIVSGGTNLGQLLSSSYDLKALQANHREVLLLAEKTGEIWTDVGVQPFPFQILSGTTIQHGIVAPYSLARFSEGSAWLAQDTRGQAIAVVMVGYQPQRISTHAVETDIADGVIDDAIAFTYQQAGHEFYVLTFPTQDKTWCYDLSTGLWHKRAWRDSYNALHRTRANCCAVFNGQVLVGDFENGKIYEYSRSVYTEDGDYILRRRRPPHVTYDLNWVFHHSLQIQFQPGVGLSSGQGSDPQAILRWSDDGGFTWSNDYNLPIGKQGKYKNRCIKRALGASRDRVYEVDVLDPVNAVVVSADLRLSGGAA